LLAYYFKRSKNKERNEMKPQKLKSLSSYVFSTGFILSLAALMAIPSVKAENTATLSPQIVNKDIVGKKVSLALPNGHCLLDKNHPADKMLIEGVKISIKGKNELLSQFANCQELKDWHSGKLKYLNNFGNYQISLKFKETDMTGQEPATIKEICEIFKKQGDTLIEGLKPDMNKRVQEGFKNVKINEMKSMGVMYQDTTICISGIFQRLKTQDNSIKDQINLTAISILNGRLIFSYLFIPHGDKTEIDQITKTMIKLNRLNQTNNNPPQ